MKKQLVTIALLLSANAALPAANGGMTMRMQPAEFDTTMSLTPQEAPREPALGTIRTREFSPGGRAVDSFMREEYLGNGHWRNVPFKDVSLELGRKTVESDRAQYEELLRNVHDILKIVTELKERQ